MKKATRIGLKVDTFLQGTTVLGIVASAFAGLVTNQFTIALALLIAFLGVLQLTSALVFVCILRDTKRRGLYLLSNLGLLSTFVFGNLVGPIHDLLIFPIQIFICLSVFALALRYLTITMQDMVRANTSYIN